MWTGLRGSVGAIPQTDLPALPGLRPCRSPDLPNIWHHQLAPYGGAFGFSKVLNCCSMWWTGVVWMIGYTAPHCPLWFLVVLQHEWCLLATRMLWRQKEGVLHHLWALFLDHDVSSTWPWLAISKFVWDFMTASLWKWCGVQAWWRRGFRFPSRQMWLMWSKHVRRVFTLKAAALRHHDDAAAAFTLGCAVFPITE